MKKQGTYKRISLLNNQGTTLIEMLVCFIMLAIFMVAAFSIITHITKLYYQVKGETYGKQVSDIILERIQAEIEGAKLDNGDVILIGDGNTEGTADTKAGTNITLYDKTNTKVMLFYEKADASTIDKVFKVKYYGFTDASDSNKSRMDNTWQFDKKMYNGYKVEDIRFIRGDALGEGTNGTLAGTYGITDTSGYGEDTIVVLLDISSDRYGDYKTYRFIRMYNFKETAPTTPTGP